MIDTKLSNLILCLCYLHSGIGSYHRGYLEEIGVNQDNVFNPDLDINKAFPSLLWIPGEGQWDIKDKSKNTFEVEMRLYDVLNIAEGGDLDLSTKNEYWDKLSKMMYQVLRELRKGKFSSTGAKEFTIRDVSWYQDVEVMTNTLIFVGVRFTVEYLVTCDDYTFDFGTLPAELVYPISGDTDYEKLSIS